MTKDSEVQRVSKESNFECRSKRTVARRRMNKKNDVKKRDLSDDCETDIFEKERERRRRNKSSVILAVLLLQKLEARCSYSSLTTNRQQRVEGSNP